MKKVVRLTESDLVRIVKRVVKESIDDGEHSKSFVRRIYNTKEDIIELIDLAKEEIDEDDYSDEFEYMDNVIYWVVQELQSRFGDSDEFWYDEEDEISDYIRDEFDDYLMN